jgi:crossover junction endodeoxyribonuclease RuvC
MTSSELVVVGLDLSLTSTGTARIGHNFTWADRIVPPANLAGHSRMSFILSEISGLVKEADLVVVEGPAYGMMRANQQGHHERAGLWWLVTRKLWRTERPFAVVAPTCLQRYATGKGRAAKDVVFAAAIRRYRQVEFDGNDAADALVLAAMGADQLGRPIATVPATHRAALGSVTWPQLRQLEPA